MKIALIGYGTIGPLYNIALKDFKPELLICTPSSNPGKNGDILYFNDYKSKEILTADIVIIASPPSSHYELLEYFVKNNKKVVVEKPAVISQEQLIKLQGLVNSNIYFAYHTAFNPLVNRLTDLLKNKEITNIGVTYEENVYDYHKPDGWIFHKDIAGGGCLIDSGINIFSVLYKFVPELEVMGGKMSNRYSPVEDLVKVQLRTSNNISIEINMDWFSTKENRIFHFDTTEGSVEVNLATNEVIIDGREEEKLKNITKIDQQSEYNELVQDFIRYFATKQTHIKYSPILPIETILHIYEKVRII